MYILPINIDFHLVYKCPYWHASNDLLHISTVALTKEGAMRAMSRELLTYLEAKITTGGCVPAHILRLPAMCPN